MRPDRAEELLSTGLACAALDGELRSILLLDAAPNAFRAAAARLEELLSAAGEKSETVPLGPAGGEDELWGTLRLTLLQGSRIIVNRPGRLAATDSGALKLVLIPDLASLSLAGQRACVALMSSDVGVLERHGQSLLWPANYCWLAACSRERMGEVSPHLLDRFVLRLNALKGPSASVSPISPSAARLNAAALARVIEIVGEGTSPRRDFALARVSRSLARLDNVPVASEIYVDRAALLLGLRPPERRESAAVRPVADEAEFAKTAPEPDEETAPSAETNDSPLPGEEPAAGPAGDDRPVSAPDTESVFAAGAAVDGADGLPYPEDTVAIRREFMALRLPGGGAASGSSGRGVIVGTQPARSLQDLAWVATLLEAAKYQRIRRRWENSGTGMILARADLRSWRRAPVPSQSLILVLDHTALAGTNWESELTPHLRWAYVERASVTLVQVGLAEAREEDALRARVVQGRSLLAPAIRQGLNLNPGNATPLADGLSQAARAARHLLQHGRSRVRTARLVVASDGRGNVPLEASRQGAVTRPVGAAGLKDALRCAAEIGALSYLDSYFLTPETEAYGEVAEEMATALRASFQRLANERS